MRRVYQVWFWTFFVVSSAFYFVGAAALWLITLPFDRNGRVLHLYSSFWAACGCLSSAYTRSFVIICRPSALRGSMRLTALTMMSSG